MITLAACLAVLIIGYIFYGRLIDKIFGSDGRDTPAISINDGVDCVPLKTWKAFLIQFLNIAGTGPIFGALMGAQFGPVVFLWIVFGSVLGGGIHDFMTGMISCRHEGKSIVDLSGIYLGKAVKWIMRIFSIVLLVLVGTVFITSPAALLADLTPDFMSRTVWIIIIIVYYILATLLPIDKVIGRLYPVFGAILLIMAVGIIGGLIFTDGYSLPELSLSNLHPQGQPVWPYMFVTVACGAVSGFHATQSPMMAKCIEKEKDGRKVFYGAMITESVIALIWAAAGVAFYKTTGGLGAALEKLGQSGVVYDISVGILGRVGGVLAIVGVVVCPVTSGDTAFRSARLILAETFDISQKKLKNRLILTVPLLALGAFLTQLDFDVIWRYFSWSNQTLAAIALWTASAYLVRNEKHNFASLITSLPAAFMSAVSVTYILMADEGLGLSRNIAYPVGVAFAVALFLIYAVISMKKRFSDAPDSIREGRDR